MEQRTNGDKRFALVIDADNVSAKYVNVILDELSKYGSVTYKRIYGDWTSTLHSKWKNTLLDNSITPIQQFSYTQGKNATDHAMIIDAMDILYTGQVDGFCIVSSDSDFTRLAARIREGGLTVIGMGEKKTPLAFRKACDIFTTLELLMKDVPTQKGHVPGKSGRPTDAPAPAISRERIAEAVIDIVEYNQNNGKDTGLGEVGSRLQKRYPDFDVRNYGTNQLRKLLESFEGITVTKEGNTLSVSLTEGAEQTPAVASQATADTEQAAASEQAPASVEATEGEGDAADEAPKKKTRRGKRGGRKNKEAAEPEPPEAATAEAAAPEATAQADEEPPAKRKTRRRSSKINATTQPAEEPAAQTANEEAKPVAQRKPSRTKKRREQPAVAPAAAEPLAPAAEAAEAAEATKVDIEAVRAFARAELEKNPELDANGLSKKVRSKFRGFKLSDYHLRTFKDFIKTL